jgi:ubiquinone/menaquinone biosynthesis C-methylase UbiE
MSKSYLPDVRNQYETLPYPERNPEDERKHLLQTIEDRLELINHYCFGGKKDFNGRFRCLVAGAGTGDAAIHLAEQLKHTGNEIVYLDISTASMEVAKERARIRGLKNITWINDSILKLPELSLGEFDYINCSGVLHHLENRVEGLRSLCSVLNNDGVIAIMVYGKVARAPVYQLQDLFRMVNTNIYDMQQKLDIAKKFLQSLPGTNAFKRLDEMLKSNKQMVRMYGDAEVYDLFLHSQDNPFSIGEIYDWLDVCDLKLVTFPSPIGIKYRFLPESYLQDNEVLEIVSALPICTQQSIAELVWGNMITHTFYAKKTEMQPASVDDLDNVPFLFIAQLDVRGLAKHMEERRGATVKINHPMRTLEIRSGRYLPIMLRYLDGKRSIREIIERVINAPGHQGTRPSETNLLGEFREFYDTMNSVDWMLLRHEP